MRLVQPCSRVSVSSHLGATLGGAILLALLSLVSAPATAFHDGGVAACSGCHIMHESGDGQIVASEGELLRAESSSDVCLLCHASTNGAVFGLSPLAPPPERGAGNFTFLLEENLNDSSTGSMNPIHGEAAGHSIVVPGMGVGPDSRWTTAPGGSFPSSELGCTSCHDPHGNQNFRMLYGAGPVQGGLHHFTYPAPQADGISLVGPGESRTHHNAYLDGWSAWCANCHDFYHDRGRPRFDHHVDHGMGGTRANWYAQYDGDANPTGGIAAMSYLPEVPFEDPVVTISWTGPPDNNSRIACISCHRAHASSAPAAGRWDFWVDRLDQDGAVSGSYAIPNPYPGPEQGLLCAKCHARDKWVDDWPPVQIQISP